MNHKAPLWKESDGFVLSVLGKPEAYTAAAVDFHKFQVSKTLVRLIDCWQSFFFFFFFFFGKGPPQQCNNILLI